MNLLFSYSVKEDQAANDAGYTFLGAAEDNQGGEVHVFMMTPMPANEMVFVGNAHPMPGTAGGFTMCSFEALNVPAGTPLYVKRKDAAG